ncbi:MAG: UDP-N-acetylmuramoyl-L-alanyl-D-glutamate--2,6-diaminopimelate ligase, partial [Bacteroidales bacterium]|nr:UDP-N-acetylmuramoyl-L-alanyl-D-glutamate--2,6-diaminopimelate ligase [Bacteroidales bacterium]
DRDKTKRPEMAKVAEDYSDRIVVTSDNSRSERTEDIMDDIRKGFSQKGLAKAIFIADRKEAIRTSIMLAPAGSIILLAGKGHETYQIIGNEHRHFDEREIASEVFANIETTE